MRDLINKYNVAGPRYTSYPTVPYWDNSSFSVEGYLRTLKATYEKSQLQGISIYIHLPFCESLCSFCACHKHISKRHEVELPYIEAVLKEWYMYINLLGERPKINELHLGGGTPTFFSTKHLKKLISGILKTSTLSPNYEFSFEAHPNNTSQQQLQTLFDLGFRRLSFGIQDYDPKVQKAINRTQSYEQVKKVTNWSKDIGYNSISHDLIFGLPFQTIQTIKDSICKTKLLLPDRISFYSYAHVPWVKGVGQRGFDTKDLPDGNEKRALYELGKKAFSDLGYVEIGMDHFSLTSDSLYQAAKDNELHRNFMGYTTNNTQLMIGLGMSAIGDSWSGFAQNVKSVKEYQKLIQSGEFPLIRGHILTKEDIIIRKHILNIMCHLETSWQEENMQFDSLEDSLDLLKEMENDGLITIENKTLIVAEMAVPFVRNVCMAFDKRLQLSQPKTRVFSMTI